MKKILVLLLGLVLLAGCNSNSVQEEKPQTAETVTENNESVKIGIIKFVEHPSLDAARDGFVKELDAKGINYELDEVSANGDISLIPTLAQKYNNDEIDLIYAIATPTAQGAKNAITDKPIIFSAVTDPVGAGLVDSIEVPGGNVTGVSDYVNASDQIDEFLVLYPEIKTFGTLYNTSEQNSQVQVDDLKKILEEKGLSLEVIGINNINDIPQGVSALSPKIDAYFALTDNMIASAAPIVAENLIKNNIPSLSSEEGQVKNGLLMSEGVSYEEQGVQAADIAIRIINGEEPKDISVEYYKNSKKLVNRKMAEALGIDLNNEIFANAEIVE
ncbi:MAG: ABC transporter substrate-binding protein [Neofamilia sp.]